MTRRPRSLPATTHDTTRLAERARKPHRPAQPGSEPEPWNRAAQTTIGSRKAIVWDVLFDCL